MIGNVSLVTIDNSVDWMKSLLALTKKAVLVGVPSDSPTRKDGSKMNNATLACIHDNGSPLQKIPARPFMGPGIAKVQDKISSELGLATKAQLNNDKEKVDLHLNKAGLIASSSIKNVINDGDGFAPLKYSTLLARMRKRKGYAAKRKRLSKFKMKGDTTAYNDLANQMGDVMSSFHPLVDTASLRNSISYVIVGEDE